MHMIKWENEEENNKKWRKSTQHAIQWIAASIFQWNEKIDCYWLCVLYLCMFFFKLHFNSVHLASLATASYVLTVFGSIYSEYCCYYFCIWAGKEEDINSWLNDKGLSSAHMHKHKVRNERANKQWKIQCTFTSPSSVKITLFSLLPIKLCASAMLQLCL